MNTTTEAILSQKLAPDIKFPKHKLNSLNDHHSTTIINAAVETVAETNIVSQKIDNDVPFNSPFGTTPSAFTLHPKKRGDPPDEGCILHTCQPYISRGRLFY